MPTYVFECPKCHFLLELSMGIKEYEKSRPLCFQDGCDGESVMKSVVQPSTFILKGSGWTPKGS
jgi:predicted nucleic acid-binding Zn ribbon protein